LELYPTHVQLHDGITFTSKFCEAKIGP